MPGPGSLPSCPPPISAAGRARRGADMNTRTRSASRMRIVVGFDGSDTALRALGRAADEIQSGGTLTLVTVEPTAHSPGALSEDLLSASADAAGLLEEARLSLGVRDDIAVEAIVRKGPGRDHARGGARRGRRSHRDRPARPRLRRPGAAGRSRSASSARRRATSSWSLDRFAVSDRRLGARTGRPASPRGTRRRGRCRRPS